MKNLFFMDLDGTLEDSRQDMAESVRAVREEFDLKPGAIDDWKGHVNAGMENLYRKCFPEFFQNLDSPDREVQQLERIRKVYEEFYYRYAVDKTELYDGIAEAVPQIAEFGPIALYTNKPAKISHKILIELGLNRHFAYIIGCDTFPQQKPAREPMDKIAEAAEFDPAQDKCIYIGDSKGDALAAAAFGATFIWCAWGYQDQAPEGTEHTAAKPGDLPGIVAGLANKP